MAREAEKVSLPKGWKKYELQELADIRNGKRNSQDAVEDGKYPLFDRSQTIKRSDKYLFDGDSVIVPGEGKEFIPRYYRGKFDLHQRCYALFNFKGTVESKYLYYYLMNYRDRFARIAVGSTVASLRLGHFQNFPVVLPPLSEQRRIAGILGSLDDKIELNRRMSETLEAMSQAVFKSWFMDFDPVIDNALATGNEIPSALQARAAVRQSSGEKSLPSSIYRFFPDEFDFTARGPIPKGWKMIAIENAMEINPSVKLKKDSIAPYVDMKALPTKGYSINGFVMKPYSGGSKFQKGDVLLARITPCLENGKTAVVDFLEDHQVGFGSTEFVVLRGKESIGTPFVACLSRDQKFRDHCVQHMAGTSGRQRVHNSCFSSFYMALPEDKRLLEKYHSLGIGNFEQMTAYGRQIQSLSNLRDMLLPKLLLHG